MTSCIGSVSGGFLEIWEKSVSWVLPSEEEGWLSLARRGLVAGAHVVWGSWKSQVYLSPHVEKPLNSKVIKSFVPELRSRKCFSCFGIPMLSIYEIWTFYVHFTHPYIGHISDYVTLMLSLSSNLTSVFVHCPRPSENTWKFVFCPVGWCCRIHWLHLCRGIRPPPHTHTTSVLIWH